jgi:hypothetical protein
MIHDCTESAEYQDLHRRTGILDRQLTQARDEVDRLDAEVRRLYTHPDCGFRWRGKDGLDVPLRDGEPVCPRCEIDLLKTVGSPGVMHDIDRGFYELVIKERDLERARNDRLTAEAQVLRTRLAAVEYDLSVEREANTMLAADQTAIETAACCTSHSDGPTRRNGLAHCCDPEDCGPCCENCPDCPTLQRQRLTAETGRLLNLVTQWKAAAEDETRSRRTLGNQLAIAEQRLHLARQALTATGYFTPDQIGDDIAPRITELHTAHTETLTRIRAELDDGNTSAALRIIDRAIGEED